MKTKIIKTIKNLCIAYICLLVLSIIASFAFDIPTYKEVGHLEKGCYWTDAMLPYIDCNGLTFNTPIKTFLNFWIMVVYSAMFSSKSIIVFGFFVVLWFPIFYLLWYAIKGRKILKKAQEKQF